MKEMKNLAEVVDIMIALMPLPPADLGLRQRLHDVACSSTYGPPEVQGVYWRQALDILHEVLGVELPAAGWQREVCLRFAGRRDEPVPVPVRAEWLDQRAFPGAMREALALGKYTRGCEDFTCDQLLGLLWLLGEYCTRADPLDTRADQMISPGDRRRIIAHNSLLKFGRGFCIGLEGARACMREAAEHK